MNIHFSSLGCRLNDAEITQWASEFQALGHQLVNDPSAADIFILNTCAVTQEAVRKSRKNIQRLQRENPQAKMVVSGCYTTLADQAELSGMGIDLVVSNVDKNKLTRRIEQKFDLTSMPQAATGAHASALFARNRQRAFIKIQDGCRYRCTYCIVTVARGSEQSQTIQEIVKQVNYLFETGVQEIVLTGVHVGGYGSDIDTSLYTLVETLLRETSIPRIRFASVEPWDLPPHFFELFDNTRLMPHMHLPMQSGSDTVLKRMARRCKTREFLDLVSTARSVVPDFNITTDIIVGFPGETDAEWQETLDFVNTAAFGDIHIFSYSKRAGTKAASMSNQIHGAIKRQRSRELHDLAAKLKKNAAASQCGKTVQVLFESQHNSTDASTNREHWRFYGYTPNYSRVRADVPAGTCLENAIALTHLDSVSNECCIEGSIDCIVRQPTIHSADYNNMHNGRNVDAPPVYKGRSKIIPVQAVADR